MVPVPLSRTHYERRPQLVHAQLFVKQERKHCCSALITVPLLVLARCRHKPHQVSAAAEAYWQLIQLWSAVVVRNFLLVWFPCILPCMLGGGGGCVCDQSRHCISKMYPQHLNRDRSGACQKGRSTVRVFRKHWASAAACQEWDTCSLAPQVASNSQTENNFCKL